VKGTFLFIHDECRVKVLPGNMKKSAKGRDEEIVTHKSLPDAEKI
jgi:hypothetical protein